MNAPTTEGTGIPKQPGTSTPAIKRALHLSSAVFQNYQFFSGQEGERKWVLCI